MTDLYSYISPNKILVIDTYSNTEDIIYSFQDVCFRIELCPDFYNFHSPIATINNKIINISNRQLSFLSYKYIHYVGDKLAIQIQSTYNNLQSENYIYIDEPVFQFVDYDSISGTGHSYDLMFYLIYKYKKNNMSCKLLVVKNNNKYYNNLLNLISKYYNIEFLYIDLNTNYKFKSFYCTRTYQNIFFNEVKEFINDTLISKIIDKYNSYPFFSTVCKLKLNNPNNINKWNDSFLLTDEYTDYLQKNNICDINTIEDEEYKIYLLNKASKIIISCCSSYYINICYYIKEYSTQHITVVFHMNSSLDLWTLNCINDKVYQNMPGHYCGNYMNQVYNNISFNGKIIKYVNSMNDLLYMLTQ